MIIRSLHLRAFRAHADTALSFSPKVNVLYGLNGAGKTNVLEAIHYLCLSKSFLTSSDTYALQKGAPFFELKGRFAGTQRPEVRVRLAYVPAEGKKMFVNGAPLERLAQIVGQLPVVIFSPGDQDLTARGPDERRRFLNNILSQARPVYLDDLLSYRRALKQRNELLSQFRRRRVGPSEEALLASWDAELVALGSRVIAGRHRFIRTFSRYLQEAHGYVEAVAETPDVTYDTIAPLPDDADEERIAALYWDRLRRAAPNEHRLGRTTIGPHRDELVFRLNDLEVRRYASQGQHRTFGMILKLAQYFYLRDTLDEPPLLLLDDVFDNLDPERTRVILDLLQSDVVGQSLITAASLTLLHDRIPFGEAEHQATRIAAGAVQDALAP